MFVLDFLARIRQLVLNTEKTGHRVPQKMQTELRALEKHLAYSSQLFVLAVRKDEFGRAFVMALFSETCLRSVAREIRTLNPLLFQRFDDVQLDRRHCAATAFTAFCSEQFRTCRAAGFQAAACNAFPEAGVSDTQSLSGAE